ncbi:DUF222 domain-containing protein, partial [Microbacterium sp. SYP-A9085]|uniref:DUF222 domain-containing protein n=1 Tax=Microbacterium sp. SYP-A9085 TaxID=2664454 RepID=UPI00129B4429
MAFFSDLEAHVEALRSLIGADPDAGSVPALAAVLDDDAVVAVIAEASAVVRAAESLRVAASGVVAARSSREAGHTGLAQVRGHRSPVALVQEITGSTRTDAVKQVRLGQALLAQVPAPAGAGGEDVAPAVTPVWHAPLGAALLAGRITVGQHDAILRGLGDPPALDADTVSGQSTPAGDAGEVAGLVAAAREEARAAWETAAVQLIGEADCRTVEELAGQARAIRDILDPDGAARRFQERFERRSFRIWTDPDGVAHGSFLFDDEAALWVRTVLDAALAPRRGVRFVDPGQQARADQLATDPRSTDQLAHDLLIDLLRTGALADAETVFATRQAGVRIIITQQAVTATAQGGAAAVAGVLDDCTTLPGWAATRHACDTGTSRCLLDTDGNP